MEGTMLWTAFRMCLVGQSSRKKLECILFSTNASPSLHALTQCPSLFKKIGIKLTLLKALLDEAINCSCNCN